jgi:hypothetical protein
VTLLDVYGGPDDAPELSLDDDAFDALSIRRFPDYGPLPSAKHYLGYVFAHENPGAWALLDPEEVKRLRALVRLAGYQPAILVRAFTRRRRPTLLDQYTPTIVKPGASCSMCAANQDPTALPLHPSCDCYLDWDDAIPPDSLAWAEAARLDIDGDPADMMEDLTPSAIEARRQTLRDLSARYAVPAHRVALSSRSTGRLKAGHYLGLHTRTEGDIYVRDGLTAWWLRPRDAKGYISAGKVPHSGEAVLVHEYGHELHEEMRRGANSAYWQMHRELQPFLGDPGERAMLAESVSTYAATSEGELVAEAFTLGYYGVYTHPAVRIVDRYFRRYFGRRDAGR